MKLLHTSDWHLGRTLCGKKRDDEFEEFLSWLVQTIDKQHIQVLIIAGDVFDNGTPSNRALSLYYGFLRQISDSPFCRHVIVIGGNHDSPSLLNAPKTLLQTLNIHIVGSSVHPKENIITLYNTNGQAEMIVCAVPYLRDRDVRTTEAGESIMDKERKVTEGIACYYAETANAALTLRQKIGLDIPIVATGHLFVTGSRSHEDDGMRDLYIGNLGSIAADTFSDIFDYVALGHLHTPQTVGGKTHIRYSGAPLIMGFGEAGQQKSLTTVDFQGKKINHIHTIPVPEFRHILSIRGDWQDIIQTLHALNHEPIWLEIIYEAAQAPSQLRRDLEIECPYPNIEILRIRHRRPNHINTDCTTPSLNELTPEDVFERRMDAATIPAEERPNLRHSHQEILYTLYHTEQP